MTERPSMWVRAFENLKRRKIFRIAAAYAVVAWFLVEVASIILPAFNAPDWVLRACVFLLFAGFPAVLILAWTFDITPRSIVRAGSDKDAADPPGHLAMWSLRLAIGLPALVAVITAGWWIWSDQFAETGSSFLRERTEGATPVVAALPMRNLTGDEKLSWLGEGIANLVRDNLAQSRYLAVVSGPRSQQLRRALDESEKSMSDVSNEGIDYVLSGEILKTPSGLTLSVRLTDLEREVDVEADRLDGLAPESLLEAASTVAALAKRGLKVPRAEKVDVFAADFATENLSAYEAFIAGMQYFVGYKYRDAEQSFRAALELAPDFSMARYRLAHIQAATGRTDEALASIREAGAADYLPERQRLYIAAAEAWFARDYALAETHYRTLLERFPYEVEARTLLTHVLNESGDEMAAIEELLVLTKQEPENQVVWSLLGDTYLQAGQFDKARPALERFAALAPQSANAHILLGDSNLAEGRLAAARAEYEQARTIDPALAVSRIKLALVAFLSNEQDAARTILRTVVDDEAVPPRYRLDAVFDLAYLLQAAAHFDEADALIASQSEALAAEKVRRALGLSVRGLSRMELGDYSGSALLIDEAIAASPGLPTRYLFARGLLELASGRIDAVRSTAAEIVTYKLPEDNPDRTEEKAAAYLSGMSLLCSNEIPAALAALREAVNKDGYAYRLYRVGLAEALFASGDAEGARRLLAEVIGARDALDPRLDLELDRQRAVRLAERLAAETADAGNTEQELPQACANASPLTT